jgi:hypothetical protein
MNDEWTFSRALLLGAAVAGWVGAFIALAAGKPIGLVIVAGGIGVVAFIGFIYSFRDSTRSPAGSTVNAAAASVWRFVTLLGLIALGIGLYLGLASITTPALNGVQDCGSAFTAGPYHGAGSAIIAACDSKRHDRLQLSLILLVAGGLVSLFASIEAGSSRSRMRS